MKTVATLAAAAGLVAVGMLATRSPQVSAGLEGTLYEQHQFMKFVATHSRTYEGAAEMRHRFGIFKSNLAYIDGENAKGHTYTLGVNQFADWTREEYRAQLTLKAPADFSPVYMEPVEGKVYASGKDWRNLNNAWGNKVVPPIQNQKQCGSCYSFAACGAMACAAMIKGCWTETTPLSEQYIVDCDQYDGGCNGGWEMNVYSWCNKEGCPTLNDYSAYVAKREACKAVSNAKRWFKGGLSTRYAPSGITGFLETIATTPIAIAIDAACQPFEYYRSGVLTDSNNECSSGIDHAVMLVGYQDDASVSGGRILFLRNSWGTSWGEDGYAQVAQGTSSDGTLLMLRYLMVVEVKNC